MILKSEQKETAILMSLERCHEKCKRGAYKDAAATIYATVYLYSHTNIHLYTRNIMENRSLPRNILPRLEYATYIGLQMSPFYENIP